MNELRYRQISPVTANKLLQGEFKTFDELDAATLSGQDVNKNISVLYREVGNKNRKGYSNYIIETIFINE